MELLFVRLNDKMHGYGMYALANGFNNGGVWYDGQKNGKVRSPGSAGKRTREPQRKFIHRRIERLQET